VNTKIVHQGYFTFEILETSAGPREILRTSDSLSVLFYDPVNRRIILVRQPRESMISQDNPEGLITETVGGRFDVKLGTRALAVKEAKEEIGAEVTEEEVILLNHDRPMALSAGALTEKAYLAFVELKSNQIENEERLFGLASEGERIRRIYVSVNDLENYICEDVRVFALIQYLLRRLKK
jgi:8-oxo-dGTP pyrophosphatase MutT (NUDIX family)